MVAKKRTFKHIRYGGFKVDQRRIVMYAILFSYGKVFCFHKSDTVAIAIVVNILQFVEYFGALFTIVGIFKANQY